MTAEAEFRDGPSPISASPRLTFRFRRANLRRKDF